MEKHRSNDCADEILRLINMYHKQGNTIQLLMSRHDEFDRTLEVNKFDKVRIIVGGKQHTLAKCPLSDVYEFPIFTKLRSNGFNITASNIPTKYIRYDDGSVERCNSWYTYYSVKESSLKPIYDAYNKFKDFIALTF